MPSVEKNPSTGHANASTSANVDQVATIKQEHGDEIINLVYPCLPNEQIGNWEFVDIPMVFKQDEM